MTYKQLLNRLNKMKPEDLDNDITVQIDGEFFMVDSFSRHYDDVLDEKHPVLNVYQFSEA